jgi:hypothetical protein
MRLSKRWWLWPATVVLLACPQKTAVWLAGGATIDSPEFILGREQGRAAAIEIGFLRVDHCEALGEGSYPPAVSAVWFLEVSDLEVSIERITYGSVPTGFVETAPARELEAGECYLVTITGDGTLRFRVGDDGRLSEVAES